MRFVLLPDPDLGAITCPGQALEPSGKGGLNISTIFPWCAHPDSLAERRARESYCRAEQQKRHISGQPACSMNIKGSIQLPKGSSPVPREMLQVLRRSLVGMTQGSQEMCHGMVAEGKARDGLKHLN